MKGGLYACKRLRVARACCFEAFEPALYLLARYSHPLGFWVFLRLLISSLFL